MEHDEVMVEREIELDATVEDVWRALTDEAELAAWLGDEVELAVAPGGTGCVVDDGLVRLVRVDEVDEGRSLAFRWWDETGGGAGASRVVITVMPGDRDGDGGSTRLRVREMALVPTRPTAWASSLRWE